jgi:glycosyltransferase involved in cell wall biosynthesis
MSETRSELSEAWQQVEALRRDLEEVRSTLVVTSSQRDELQASIQSCDAVFADLQNQVAHWQGRYFGMRNRFEQILRRYGVIRVARLFPRSVRVFVRNRMLAPPAPISVIEKRRPAGSARDAFAILRRAFDRSVIGLPGLLDPLGHSAEVGSRIGLQPNLRLDSEFLRPFYEASGFFEPPAKVWLKHSTLDSPLPVNWSEADAIANSLRMTSFFDPDFYGAYLPAGMDAALHYAVIGERTGKRPSTQFDPTYYLERYPDLKSVSSLALHFHYNGRGEGRRGVSVADRMNFPPLRVTEKPVVLMIVHEASRTGAPVLGWNIARLLAQKATIVSLMMRGGELENHFAAVAGSSIGPLTWEDWNGADASRLAKRIVEEFKPLYAIANSIETNIMVPALAAYGVPSVALVHEFAAYTRPIAKMRNVYDWATHVVFPSQIVAQSSYDAFLGLEKRPGLHIMAQGPNDPPPASAGIVVADNAGDELLESMCPKGDEKAFVVLGAGAVQTRKGVDLFVSAAAAAKRLRPDIRFRFVWIGHGYDPEHDTNYSVYLAYQIAHSGLDDSLVMLNPVANLEGAYSMADAFFISSRLDPQPNVGIDAVTRGIPTVCFEGACGTAEILAADSATRRLIAPHLDTYSAALILCELADDPDRTSALRVEVARVGRAAYDMEAYVKHVDKWGRSAAAALHDEDLATLADTAIVDPDMALPPGSAPRGLLTAERQVLQLWSMMGLSADTTINPRFRRPCAGFNPQVYAQASPKECGEGQAHPLAHWVRAGRPTGPWSREVFQPTNMTPAPSPEAIQRVALHAHFYYESLAGELAERLARNRIRCDLFLSTDTKAKAKHLKTVFTKHRGSVDVVIAPNRGRDIGPFFTALSDRLADGNYDMIGHVHAKRSFDTDAAMGEAWRNFLWENLVGGEYPMLDLAAAVFASKPTVGLLMAEDPHLVGWNKNREIAENLAEKMGISTPLPDFFDFPLGSMFWCRPDALRPMFRLSLGWKDYPSEPVPYDGTILHAIERLLPFVVKKTGYEVAGVRVPGTNW